MVEPFIHTHDQAITALCGCAATVTVLSYQEAIEGYLSLRGLTVADIDLMVAPLSYATPTAEGVA